jgi:hypothetical protein
MKRFGILLTVILLAGPSASAYAQSKDVTIAYDVGLREFTCWREGPLTPAAKTVVTSPANRDAPCTTENWHPVTGDMYFVRGQVLSLLLVHGVAADLFALDLAVADLPEPGTPILGDISSLPKMLPLIPGPTLVAGAGAAFISGSGPLRGVLIRLLVSTEDDKDIRAWVKATLLDAGSAKEVQELLAADVRGAIQHANTHVPGLLSAVGELEMMLGGVAEPTSLSTLVIESKELAMAFEVGRSFRESTAMAGVAVDGKTINDAARAFASTPIAAATRLNVQELKELENHFEAAFPDTQRFSLIGAIRMVQNRFVVPNHNVGPPLDEFLAELTQAAGGAISAGADVRLRKNLTALAEMWPDVKVAIDRYGRLESLGSDLETYKTAPSSLFTLQSAIDAMGRLALTKALMINTVARTMPLDSPFDLLPIGFWFGSKEITVSLKQGQRLALFDVGAAGETSRLSVVGGDNGAGRPVAGPPADLATIRTLRVRVYNQYRFQLGIGLQYSTTDDKRFTVVKQTTGSGDAAVTEQFIDPTRDRNYTLLATADLMFFPKARHRFPFRPRYAGEPQPPFWHDIGAMFGLSLTNPGQDFLMGAVWFPRASPVGLKLGYHLGLRDMPPDDVPLSTPITTRTVVLQQKAVHGFYTGLTFNTDFFITAIAQAFKAP